MVPSKPFLFFSYGLIPVLDLTVPIFKPVWCWGAHYTGFNVTLPKGFSCPHLTDLQFFC